MPRVLYMRTKDGVETWRLISPDPTAREARARLLGRMYDTRQLEFQERDLSDAEWAIVQILNNDEWGVSPIAGKERT